MAEEEARSALVIEAEVVVRVLSAVAFNPGSARSRGAIDVVAGPRARSPPRGVFDRARLRRCALDDPQDRGVEVVLIDEHATPRELATVSRLDDKVDLRTVGGAVPPISSLVGDRPEQRAHLLVAKMSAGEAAQAEERAPRRVVEVRREGVVAGPTEELKPRFSGDRGLLKVILQGCRAGPCATICALGRVGDPEVLSLDRPAADLRDLSVDLPRRREHRPRRQGDTVGAGDRDLEAVVARRQERHRAYAEARDQLFDARQGRVFVREGAALEPALAVVHDDVESKRVGGDPGDVEVHERPLTPVSSRQIDDVESVACCRW